MLQKKNKMYRKMLVTNAFVILFVLVLMGGYFYFNTRKIKIEQAQEVLSDIVSDMNEYLVEIQEDRELIKGILYEPTYQVNDLINFMSKPTSMYVEDKLNQFIEGEISYDHYVTDTISLIKDCFELSQPLELITLLSEKETILGNKYYKKIAFERSGESYSLPNNYKVSQMKFPTVATTDGNIHYIHPVINPAIV